MTFKPGDIILDDDVLGWVAIKVETHSRITQSLKGDVIFDHPCVDMDGDTDNYAIGNIYNFLLKILQNREKIPVKHSAPFAVGDILIDETSPNWVGIYLDSSKSLCIDPDGNLRVDDSTCISDPENLAIGNIADLLIKIRQERLK